MDITLFLPDFHGHARTLPYFRPPQWYYPIFAILHGHYPILSHFGPPPWILPYFTLFPTVCTDITLVYPLFDRLLGYYPTFFMHLHRTSSLASHRPLTTTRDSLRQRPVPRSRPSRGGQSQQTTSLHSSANRTATVNV